MRRRAGFTLIEVLAAVFLTGVVMTVAITLFVDLSDATDAASEKARTGRRALAVIDRVARDVEAAYIQAKPDDLDPIAHPWFFVGLNEEGEPAADRIQFTSRNHRPRNLAGHGSDLALITWMLEPAEDGPGYQLLRAVEPGLPTSPPGDFLSADDERFMVVAEDIEQFGIRFLGEEREWIDEWDSSQIEQSGQLPLAVEIEIAYLPERESEDPGFEEFGALREEEFLPPRYARHVMIPMRPVDVDQMLRDELDQQAAEERESEVDTTEDEIRELLDQQRAAGRGGNANDEDNDSRGR